MQQSISGTKGKYRKQMKSGYSEKRYHQSSKDETMFSVIIRVMGDNVRSARAKGQNNELRFRAITYNANRIVNPRLFFYGRISPMRNRIFPLADYRAYAALG